MVLAAESCSVCIWGSLTCIHLPLWWRSSVQLESVFKKRSSHDCGLVVFCRNMTSTRCYRSPCILSRPNCTPEACYLIHSWFHWGCVECKKKRKRKKKLKNKRSLFYLPFGEMHCSDMNKEKVHLVCWIMCKLVITQSEYLYNCLYFFIMILERNVFIFLTSVPDVSSVGLTLWLVWWDSYLCIEPLLWWILCMQCLGNTVGNMGRSWY